MNIIWTHTAWSQYIQWPSKEKTIVKKCIDENKLFL